MITVPISYFDPTNGQATTLKERIDELFKTDNRVKVTELNKEYGIAQITELMADVTSFLSKNRMQGNLKLSRNNYANNTEFIKAIKDEFSFTVPPTKLSFDSKTQLEEFVKAVNENTDTKPTSKHLFQCKMKNRGLALNLTEHEIRTLKDESFPITLSFGSINDVANFAWTYDHPLNIKGITKEESQWDGGQKNQKAKAIALGAILGLTVLLMAAIKVVPELLPAPKPVAVEDSTGKATDSMPQWVYGTWSVTTPYGTETYKIDKYSIVNVSSGNVATGSYTYSDGVIRAKFSSDGGVVTTLPLDFANQRIEYGEGYYFHKK